MRFFAWLAAFLLALGPMAPASVLWAQAAGADAGSTVQGADEDDDARIKLQADDAAPEEDPGVDDEDLDEFEDDSAFDDEDLDEFEDDPAFDDEDFDEFEDDPAFDD
ncbi:hypothetical protein HN937_14545, partial [Candidatus Poribacteria bacterium]|nr:hypothetical protein [Candidatus Poribacteria bacterium]